MLSDQRETERVTKAKQPGSCLQCHASNTQAYRQAGWTAGAPGTLTDALFSANGRKQLFAGFEKVCAMPSTTRASSSRIRWPASIATIPQSMQLRVTRPGFLEGIAALAKSTQDVPPFPSIARWREGSRTADYDPEHGSEPPGDALVRLRAVPRRVLLRAADEARDLPVAKGLGVDRPRATTTRSAGRTSSTPNRAHRCLKAQHPEFEMWSSGIHARSGVACADCHMPYVREGAVKISDHHVQSRS
jgi:nitrite reductase (cytochrome c-552)